MQKLEFPALTAQDVEVRVGQCSEKGCSLLLYKDARCDMRILDNAVGADRWMCKYNEIHGNLFCSVGILCDQNNTFCELIWKQDVGVPSNMEGEKGEASDAFKRACFKWGIGRELYTAPFIWVPAEQVNITQGRNGKPTTYDRFSVTSMTVEDGRITDLEIRNDRTGATVFSMSDKTGKPKQASLKERTIAKIRKLNDKAEELGMGQDVAELTSTAMFGTDIASLDQEQLNSLGMNLKDTIDAMERGEA